MKKILFFLLLFTAFGVQKMTAQTANQFNSWWTYSGNHSINEHFSLHTLYSFRRNDFAKNWQQSLLRVGVNYHLSDKLILTPGYDWVVTFPYGEQPIGKKTTEHRVYEQFMLKNKVGKIGINHRYRFEQRFFNDDLHHRMRYRLSVNVPLEKVGHGLSFDLFDEAFVNFGKDVKPHYFDQNWFYVGLKYVLPNDLAIKLGYMNQYLVKTDNSHIENNHTPQFGLVYNLKLRKT